MKVRIGNIFEQVKVGVIVHGCNAQGVMGSGVAKEVKERYPGAFQLYRSHCEMYGIGSKGLLGTTPAWVNSHPVDNEIDPTKHLVIVNAITQLNYGRDGQRYVSYAAVQEAFDNIRILCKAIGATDINFPMIGAGLGGGDWSVISTIIQDCMEEVNQTLWVLD